MFTSKKTLNASTSPRLPWLAPWPRLSRFSRCPILANFLDKNFVEKQRQKFRWKKGAPSISWTYIQPYRSKAVVWLNVCSKNWRGSFFQPNFCRRFSTKFLRFNLIRLRLGLNILLLFYRFTSVEFCGMTYAAWSRWCPLKSITLRCRWPKIKTRYKVLSLKNSREIC